MSATSQQGLSEAEIDRLATRLAANTHPGALSLEAVDGLFCALIASPRSVMPHEYLPVILGGTLGEGGMLGDLADVQDLMALLMRYWNSIAEDFERETVHLAYVEESGVDGIQGRTWARGYIRGTRLAPEGWSRIFSDDREGLLLSVPIAAGEVDPEWPKEPLTRERNDELLQSMLAGAARAYRYFREDRIAYARAAARPEPYERASPKIGRNDPCPCGSGKKYKRCCGRAGAQDANVH
ncbi:MAG: UPF0149 family protein [Steroidobacteraceae bacterium]